MDDNLEVNVWGSPDNTPTSSSNDLPNIPSLSLYDEQINQSTPSDIKELLIPQESLLTDDDSFTPHTNESLFPGVQNSILDDHYINSIPLHKSSNDLKSDTTKHLLFNSTKLTNKKKRINNLNSEQIIDPLTNNLLQKTTTSQEDITSQENTTSPENATTNENIISENSIENQAYNTTTTTNVEFPLINFTIEIKNPIKVNGFVNSHVEYIISSTSNLSHYEVRRRYTDFRWLYRQLQNNHWGIIIPPPPNKQAVGRYRKSFIENRMIQLQKMLDDIASNPVLNQDQDFLLFLMSDNFAKESIKRQNFTGSKSYHDDNDLSNIHISIIQLLGHDDAIQVLQNGGIDDGNNTFMGVSFSLHPKYIEPDHFFTKQMERIAILEDQFEKLSRALKLINSNQLEFVTYLEDFAVSINDLASVISFQDSQRMLEDFAQLHLDYKNQLINNPNTIHLYFENLIDDYSRYFASTRAILNQREKIGDFLTTAEYAVKENNEDLARLNSSSASQAVNQERISFLSNQSKILMKRSENIRQKWYQVGKIIKQQIHELDTKRISDVKHGVEN
ncbi:hypothetical protein TBLA_0A09300 [Henningerozyma blattae CBS 6284]|uniref:PX domain-containing protein n=1 Tax=Henningerozyma blattae (strain ATCC 34711 / CBS 6284 / DSM 70876 / NBRC 10599 / NRRL Y-10934 / UCD 77-7) TaxID=1071380 RepID=I2GX65_HENB6|nr:hypothetical protein TBLA_0A09300 [Tetrapisispora blattae CBS 6284]CCH58717.1 hypothetical protein TBLA_0A09300 [Tetrapisispora blattae CBS 6284]